MGRSQDGPLLARSRLLCMRAARVEAKAFLVSAQNQLQQTISHSLHYWKFDGYRPLDRLHKNSDTLSGCDCRKRQTGCANHPLPSGRYVCHRDRWSDRSNWWRQWPHLLWLQAARGNSESQLHIQCRGHHPGGDQRLRSLAGCQYQTRRCDRRGVSALKPLNF